MVYDVLEAVWYNFEEFYGRFWVPDSLFVYICNMSSVCICCGYIWFFFCICYLHLLSIPLHLILWYLFCCCICISYVCSCCNILAYHPLMLFWICILEPPALLYDCIMIMHKSHVFDSFPCMCLCTNLHICWNVFFNASHCKSIDALFTLYEFFKMQSHVLTQYCVCL